MTSSLKVPVSHIWKALSLSLLTFTLASGCHHQPFDPTPVVPASSTLPYSAKVKVSEVGTFEVEPGASMGADPQLQSRVSRTIPPLLSTNDPTDWERATVKYLTTRKTFRSVVQEGTADLDLTLRINMYVDPSVGSGFSQIYLAVMDATLSDPRTGRSLMKYSGFGKMPGDEKDKGAMERALHAALRDVFSKMESDKRLLTL
ncbi:exported protein of unknown function [Nitrospira japonica]|uniref:Lipoprotein n=1 Tax=Nitrospira japonica TaxID=1325564 RepID=A0A1W1I5N9_9BACT|nr:hypothetical protein [Nitrospira japonica]SLM48314.1 exported protein of unknown function [Nitrospira japonica]